MGQCYSMKFGKMFLCNSKHQNAQKVFVYQQNVVVYQQNVVVYQQNVVVYRKNVYVQLCNSKMLLCISKRHDVSDEQQLLQVV